MSFIATLMLSLVIMLFVICVVMIVMFMFDLYFLWTDCRYLPRDRKATKWGGPF